MKEPWIDTRAFAKGDITAENNERSKMVRLRIPTYVYDELTALAVINKVMVGRMIIEVLRTVADKRIAKRQDVDGFD